jgi:hypothetical protein
MFIPLTSTGELLVTLERIIARPAPALRHAAAAHRLPALLAESKAATIAAHQLAALAAVLDPREVV